LAPLPIAVSAPIIAGIEGSRSAGLKVTGEAPLYLSAAASAAASVHPVQV
jgi:hypothetical protein